MYKQIAIATLVLLIPGCSSVEKEYLDGYVEVTAVQATDLLKAQIHLDFKQAGEYSIEYWNYYNNSFEREVDYQIVNKTVKTPRIDSIEVDGVLHNLRVTITRYGESETGMFFED